MGFKASQRRSVPLDAPASQPSSGVVHSMSGFFSQTPYEPWCYSKDCATAMLSEHDMDSTTSAIGVGKIMDRRVQRTTPRRSIHHTREIRNQILPHMARARLGYLEGVYGNAEPHPLAWSGGACPVRPDAPGVVSCPNRRGKGSPTDGGRRGRRGKGG
jgi:hypothetical protein